LKEGSWAAGLHDVLHPHLQRLVVCDPRKNALQFIVVECVVDYLGYVDDSFLLL
jgi:hypothetical protein